MKKHIHTLLIGTLQNNPGMYLPRIFNKPKVTWSLNKSEVTKSNLLDMFKQYSIH